MCTRWAGGTVPLVRITHEYSIGMLVIDEIRHWWIEKQKRLKAMTEQQGGLRDNAAGSGKL